MTNWTSPTWIMVGALLVALGLTGCASGPTYQNYKWHDAACVKGDSANVIRYYSQGEAFVSISKIDGWRAGGFGPYCLEPGKHRIGVSASNIDWEARVYFDLNFEAAKTYKLRANRRESRFVFQFVDVTSPQEVKIAEFNMEGIFKTQPLIIMLPSN